MNGASANGDGASKLPTSAIVIIGDEVLNGKQQDTNSFYLIRSLTKNGITVKRCVTVPDDADMISKEVKLASETYDWVFTSGGIGPTHDDITFESVAAAFGEGVAVNEDLGNMVRKSFGKRATEHHMKLATIPQSAELLFPGEPGDTFTYPVVKMRNVFILPGIPQLLKKQFTVLLEKGILGGAGPAEVRDILLKARETDVAQSLIDLNNLHDEVDIGSYPVLGNPLYSLRVSLQSRDKDTLEKAYGQLVETIPDDLIIHTHDLDLDEVEKSVYDYAHSNVRLAAKVKEALVVMEEAVERYGLDNISLSFNGGKDCTLLLHMWTAVHRRLLKQTITARPDLSDERHAVYITHAAPFDEVEHFVLRSEWRYKLCVDRIEGTIKDGLWKYSYQRPNIKGIIIGTRRSDPHGKTLGAFTPCDNGWPDYMRINPILDWSYEDVWTFLIDLQVPYCSLYDHGYTSLGNRLNTKPNPALKSTDHPTGYKPAHTLKDENMERHGR
eukprot:Clim_evm129s147 gene=Clim_evmTU129s147